MRYLVDTNVLVYAFNRIEEEKRRRAAEIIDILVRNGTGAISTQVLGELHNSVTRKILSRLLPDEGEAMIALIGRVFPVFPITHATVLEAVRGSARYQIHYYDALIWATAKLNGPLDVLSEDLTDGQLIEGVRIVNPLRAGFEVESLGGRR